jgi:polyhydroxybutyrate depolymerase
MRQMLTTRGIKLGCLAYLLVTLVVLPGVGCRLASPKDEARRTITHDGLERTYYLHIPSSYDGTAPTPLVMALHGGGGSAEKMNKLTNGGLNLLADQQGFIVVYPQGVDKHWNDGRKTINETNADDVGFLSTLIDHLAAEYNIDTQRVYATGISNGGFMSFRLACELSDKISAIAPVTAALSTDLAPTCSPSQPVSILLINGTDDPLVPWEGGEIEVGRHKRGKVLSTADTIEFWAAQNHCATSPIITQEPDSDPNDGTQVRRESRKWCDNGTEVVLYAIEGGGHTWPGGWQYLPERIVGKTSRDIDANQIIWRFFQTKVRQQYAEVCQKAAAHSINYARAGVHGAIVRIFNPTNGGPFTGLAPRRPGRVRPGWRRLLPHAHLVRLQ